MFEELHDIQRRYEELAYRISTPEAAADAAAYAALMRDYKELTPLVETWQSYRALQAEIAEEQQALQDEQDPAFTDMVQQELRKNRETLSALEENLKLLLSAGFKDITMCDRKGAIYAGREGLNWIKEEMAQVTNRDRKAGTLADMLAGADVFIGVSAPGTVTTEMVKTMAKDAIVFACANPTPEIFPDEARAGGAAVIATGRSDFPNQINNVLAFPGVFRGTFDVRASDINEEMKMAAADALAGLISDEELSADYIIPKAFDKRVGPAVAKAVAEAARRSGVARI